MHQLKKIAFLVPKPGLGDQDFRRYWREVHGPLVAGSPGYGEWRLRYAQNHGLGPGPLGRPFAFAGLAEFWLPGRAPNEDAFSETAIYRERIAPDERNFIDMQRTISFAALEQVLVVGRGPRKVIVLSRRAGGLDEAGLRATLAAAAETLEILGLRGWRADHGVHGSFRLPGGRHVDPLAIDCVESLWFATEADMGAFFARTANLRAAVFDGDATMAMHADEHVFFDMLGRQADGSRPLSGR